MVQGSLSLLRLFISSRGLDIGRIAGRLAAKSFLLCADRVLGPAWTNAWRHLDERRHQALARVVIVTSPPTTQHGAQTFYDPDCNVRSSIGIPHSNDLL